VLDKITGVPGSVWLEFKEVNSKDLVADATWIAALRAGFDADAVVPAKWAREYLGIPPDEDDPLDRVEQIEYNVAKKVNPFGQPEPEDIEEPEERVPQ
jgi:hypothetical protein